MKHLGDITKISGYDAPTVDVIVGGSPCQDLSIAGKRAGLDGERSGLFMEQIRIIKEMREKDVQCGRTDVDIRPRYMVWENVPGAFSSNKGEDFRVVLEETAKVCDKDASIPMPNNGKWTTAGCILGDGWSIAWRVLDAQFWGVPQRRRRIALVADFGGHSAPEILFVRKSLSGDTDKSNTEGKRTPSNPQGSIGAGCSHVITFEPGISGREGGHVYDDVSGRLRANAGDNQMAVAYVVENHPVDSRVNVDESGVVQTLTSRMETGGGNVPLVMTFAKSRRAQSETDFETWNESGIANTLNLFDQGDVRATNIVVQSCKPRYTVRRLTPLECERLQGYPDNWTLIGEPVEKVVEEFDEDTGEKEGEHIEQEFYYTNSQGKRVKASDSSRYKALGNSIAIPPWKWVMKRLCACYERDATLASLFDGIGGFPLIWEQLNGKGTCLWASEIEEFPIAVTKKRIGG